MIFQKKKQDPSLCLLDAIFSVWINYVNKISQNHILNNQFELNHTFQYIKQRGPLRYENTLF